METNFTLECQRSNLEQAEGWRTINQSLPYIKFPANWVIKLLLPTGGAALRFLVTTDTLLKSDSSDKVVSVYFDQFSRLGCMDKPYYEIYPNTDDDCSRFFPTEDGISEMLIEIQNSLNKLECRD